MIGYYEYFKSSDFFGAFLFAGSMCKNSAVLFTFWGIYGIITLVRCLIDKLEFDEEDYDYEN